MDEVLHFLEDIGLAEYCEKLVEEGFDDMGTLMDITESDLHVIQMKVGHIRKLQRAIAEKRGIPNCEPLFQQSYLPPYIILSPQNSRHVSYSIVSYITPASDRPSSSCLTDKEPDDKTTFGKIQNPTVTGLPEISNFLSQKWSSLSTDKNEVFQIREAKSNENNDTNKPEQT